MENGTETGVESILRKFIETDLNSQLQALRLAFGSLYESGLRVCEMLSSV